MVGPPGGHARASQPLAIGGFHLARFRFHNKSEGRLLDVKSRPSLPDAGVIRMKWRPARLVGWPTERGRLPQ